MLKTILERLDRLRPQSVCVEAGHIYINEKPGEEHIYCARLGAQIAETLSQKGFKPIRMLFVDDYHPEISDVAFGLSAYVDLLASQGFKPDEVVMESELVKPAFCLMRSLPDGEKINRDGKVCLVKPNLTLMSGDGTISCNLLDATLYLDKFRKFQFSITVLPEAYKVQQKNVKRLLKAMGHNNFPAANVYYDKGGQVRVIV